MTNSAFPGTPRQSKFRNSTGKLLTKALFYEFSPNAKHVHTLYTLKDVEWKGYPSLHKAYMEMEDLTEYDFALAYFESWKHWQRVTQIPEFRPILDEWRKELELKITARVMRNVATEAGKGSFTANRILLEYATRPRDSNDSKSLGASSKRGRPSKEEVENRLQEEVDEQKRLQNDMARLLGEENDTTTEETR